MSARRRAELMEVVAARELCVIDDGINGFLAPEQAPLAGERTIVLDSLSKRLGPGLTLGFVSAPPVFADRVASAIRSGGWAPTHFAVEAATRLMGDGTVAKIEAAKRADAADRQALAHSLVPVRSDRRSYHCWWELPDPWRAETFVAAAARRGIAVTRPRPSR